MWQPSIRARRASTTTRSAILAAGVMLAGIAAAAAFAPQVRSPRGAQLMAQTNPGMPNFPDIVDSVRASVIGVKTVASAHPGAPAHPGGFPTKSDLRRTGLVADPLLPFGEEGEPNSGERIQVLTTQGSGFFISADGYAVTNGHVVGNSDSAEVETDDGKTLPAKVVGVDSVSDLGLIKVEGSGYSPVKFAPQPPRVGEWVLAIGNPFGLGGTV